MALCLRKAGSKMTGQAALPHRNIHEQKLLILQYALENGSVTRKEVEDLIGAETTKAFRLLKELCKAGKLEQKGSGRLSTYISK